jgi:putative methionine-R-sulfoxide reductase with GAF domain
VIDAAGGDRGTRLRRLEAVIDAALARLDVADLFDELLDRIRELLEVDTAVILLLDAHSQQLVVTAARGLEDEIRHGLRIGVGQGFAGQIAATRRPLAIERVGPQDVTSPILLRLGIRSLMGVPMSVGADLVGVLHVGTLTERQFTAEDVRLLERVAEGASRAGQARLASLDHAAALALQRSLLPAQLPGAAGIQLAARYLPGHAFGVGGDWFDVFALPTGWLGVVIGDVSGHGLRSAVVMGRIRSALRAYALVCEDPADALTLLDRKVRHFEAGSMTTALYAMISADRGLMRISVAGHLRPIVAAPGRAAAEVDVPVDLPLGTGADKLPRRSATVQLPPAATVVAYTDGLVERRGEVIDAGIARLTAAVRPGPAETVCATVIATVAPTAPTDDVALLVVSREPDAAGPGTSA